MTDINLIEHTNKLAKECEDLRQQLAECQAREREKNEALRIVQAAICLAADDAPESTIGKLYDHVSTVVVMPSDSTALDTMKHKWQREALLVAADYVDTFAISNDTPVTAVAWHIRRMVKELE
jgi:hypothetical protein